ncbi:hypothetical protein NE237_013628 [Protea cynaroides]|uniref:Uncharacterized protein n=1 Tax=Protea cynaroides TaxID=273540 RepID=A0A9Q0H2F7_9MAGN|nr:hypothetical protein NE237_013628 [Protea cynaroides]
MGERLDDGESKVRAGGLVLKEELGYGREVSDGWADHEQLGLWRDFRETTMLGTLTSYLPPTCFHPSMALKNPLFRLSNGFTILTPVAIYSSSIYQGRTYSVKALYGIAQALKVTKSKPPDAEALTVTKSKPEFVCPTMKTYDGFYYLSPFDEALMGPLDILFSFEMDGKRTENLFETIKQALAKALVHFYPLAGRFKQDPDGRFVVKCIGEGVPFVEAVANCDLGEFGDFTIPNLPKLRKLIHASNEVKNPLDVPPFAVQVTRFKCGGFVLGIATNHSICDGAALMAFMKSWADLARGLPLSVPPFLDRSIMKPRQLLNNISPTREDVSKVPLIRRDVQSVFKSFCFDPKKLMHLKKIAMEDGNIKKVTDFELIIAFMWCARTKALKINIAEPSKLLIAIDGRKRLGSSLPKGYFGNAIYVPGCECSAGELIERPLSFAVDQMKSAIESVPIQSLNDYIEAASRKIPLDEAIVGNKWSRLPSNDIDFGWGSPKQFTNASPQKEIAIVHAQSKDSKNKILTLGLPPPDMKAFEEVMESEMGMRACI